MDQFKTSGRFFFETFMPGVFLLCHILLFAIMLLVACYHPSAKDMTDSIRAVSDVGKIALGLIVAVSFGYGLGTVLRLRKVAWVDRMSGEFLCHFKHQGHRKYVNEPFFYLGWLEEKLELDGGVRRLPEATRRVIDEVWRPYYSTASTEPVISKRSFLCRLFLPQTLSRPIHHALDWDEVEHAYDEIENCSSKNTAIFNWCKSVLRTCDSAAVQDAFEAEWKLRYIAGMVYALRTSVWLMISGSVFSFAGGFFGLGVTGTVLAAFYGYLMIMILAHLRFLRCKEVEGVFSAIHINMETFRRYL